MMMNMMDLLSHNVNMVTVPELEAFLMKQVCRDGLVELSHVLKYRLWFVETLVDEPPLFCIRCSIPAQHVIMPGNLECMCSPYRMSANRNGAQCIDIQGTWNRFWSSKTFVAPSQVVTGTGSGVYDGRSKFRSLNLIYLSIISRDLFGVTNG